MELNAEDLRRNMEKANACLDKQRDGVEPRGSSGDSGTESNSGILRVDPTYFFQESILAEALHATPTFEVP